MAIGTVFQFGLRASYSCFILVYHHLLRRVNMYLSGTKILPYNQLLLIAASQLGRANARPKARRYVSVDGNRNFNKESINE